MMIHLTPAVLALDTSWGMKVTGAIRKGFFPLMYMSSYEKDGRFQCLDRGTFWFGRRDRYSAVRSISQFRTDGPAAKNVVLAGVKSVTVYDPEPVVVQDLSAQVA
jgi:hypothetical protein